MTVLKPGDLLTAIRIPSTWAGAQFYFEKIRDRQVWDFPLVNVASAAVYSGGNIERIRIAVNGVAAHPLRLKAGGGRGHRQAAQRGHGEDGGRDGHSGREPLRYNGYKVPLMRNLVKRAIRGVPGAAATA